MLIGTFVWLFRSETHIQYSIVHFKDAFCKIASGYSKRLNIFCHGGIIMLLGIFFNATIWDFPKGLLNVGVITMKTSRQAHSGCLIFSYSFLYWQASLSAMELCKQIRAAEFTNGQKQLCFIRHVFLKIEPRWCRVFLWCDRSGR